MVCCALSTSRVPLLKSGNIKMRKLILLALAVGAVILLKRRTDELGSVGAAVESLKNDLVDTVANNPGDQRPLWQRLNRPASAPSS
jgi:hypothetical protein